MHSPESKLFAFIGFWLCFVQFHGLTHFTNFLGSLVFSFVLFGTFFKLFGFIEFWFHVVRFMGSYIFQIVWVHWFLVLDWF